MSTAQDATFICPARRMTADDPDGPASDSWVEGAVGVRCSYCHCLEPGLFLAFCDRAARGDDVEVNSTDRRGVWTVRRPGAKTVGFTARHMRQFSNDDFVDALARIHRGVRESEARFWERTRAELGRAP